MVKQNIVEQIFSPVGQGIRGMARGLFPGAASTADLKRKQIEQLLESQQGQNLLNKARRAAIDRGKGLDASQRAYNLSSAMARLESSLFFEGNPELKSAMTNKLNEVLSEVSPARDNREYFAPQDETDVFDALSKRKKTYEAPTEWLRTQEVPEVLSEIERERPLADYFQASTPTVPEENIPKTFGQLGITNVDDMQTLQEMQEALPEVDMRQEYESDPELMKKLIELWRAKKLNKSNLHKAFGTIQQRAQETLGIR